MNQSSLRARIVGREPLHEGFLRVYRYRFELEKHAGGLHQIDWELMERGDSVGVLGYDPQRDAVLLGNECRPGVLVNGGDPFRDQLIAGSLDGDESPLAAAVREMREESGLELREPRLIHPGVYASSGGTSERIALVFGHVDLAHAAGAVHGQGASEDVLSVVMPAAQFIERVYSGAVDDCKTLVAGYWFARHRSAPGNSP